MIKEWWCKVCRRAERQVIDPLEELVVGLCHSCGSPDTYIKKREGEGYMNASPNPSGFITNPKNNDYIVGCRSCYLMYKGKNPESLTRAWNIKKHRVPYTKYTSYKGGEG